MYTKDLDVVCVSRALSKFYQSCENGKVVSLATLLREDLSLNVSTSKKIANAMLEEMEKMNLIAFLSPKKAKRRRFKWNKDMTVPNDKLAATILDQIKNRKTVTKVTVIKPINADLTVFKALDLVKELRRRGYECKVTKTIIETL